MNDNSLQLLTALAEKLGTTVDFLWGVLLVQAPITGIIDLTIMVCWVVLTILWCRFVFQQTTPTENTDDGKIQKAKWAEESCFFAWVSAVVLVLITAFLITASFTTIVSALINPEYWALSQIMKGIR